jgi:hypothetical protein
MQLARVKEDLEKEYERTGKQTGIPWDRFVDESRSMVAVVYR